MRRLTLLGVLAITVTGCLTGPRPTLSDQEFLPTTGDARADRLAALLSEPTPGPFTASYRISNNFGAITRSATVAHDVAQRRSVTVGSVRFLIDGASVSTCRPSRSAPPADETHRAAPSDTSASDGVQTQGDDDFMLGSDEVICSATLDDAAISDLQITHQFYERSPATRLTADARRRIGPIDTYEAEFAGRRAECMSIPVDGGSKVYCVLDVGILASYQGPDVIIELLDYTTSIDERSYDSAP
jgi:hypothetical protein